MKHNNEKSRRYGSCGPRTKSVIECVCVLVGVHVNQIYIYIYLIHVNDVLIIIKILIIEIYSCTLLKTL